MGGRLLVASLLALAVMAVGLVQAGPVWACSCAQPTVDEVLEHEPEAAVARVLRIDLDGGSSGVGHVEETLHGGPLPEQVPLRLDDGASCWPWVAVGDVAVLAFLPDGDAWRTMECGLLDPSAGLDPVTPDPAASPPVSVVLAGRFPGADLLALDDHLRVLAAGSLPGPAHGLRACTGRVLVETYHDGRAVLVLADLPGLEVLHERPLASGGEVDVQVRDASCAGDRVDVLTAVWASEQPRLELRRDVFGDDRAVDLPNAVDAALAGDHVLLLRESGDRDGLRLERYDPATGGSEPLLSTEGTSGFELAVAPDGRHALVRGFADGPLLLVVDLASGEEVARSTGSWQPVRRPWLGPDRIVQLDEDAGGIGGTGLAHHRIADLDLAPVATLDPAPGWVTAAGHDAVVRADGRGVAVIGGSGTLVRTAAHQWAGGVHEALLLGAVAVQPGPVVADLPPVQPGAGRPPVQTDPPVLLADDGDGSGQIATAATVAAALLAGLVLAVGVARRR